MISPFTVPGGSLFSRTSLSGAIGGVDHNPLVRALAQMNAAWGSHSTRLRERLESLKDVGQGASIEEFAAYLRDFRRRNPNTIRQRVRQLRFMERHETMPVQLYKGGYQFANTFYLYVRYRETVEGAKPSALINDHKAAASWASYLGVPRDVLPTAPTEPMNDDRELPSPEDVYAVLHAQYVPRADHSYNQALLKTLLLLDFGLGVRFPSEAHALRIEDFDPENHTLVITEPKKSGRRRRLMIEPEWLCCSTRHPSLGNYVHWRAKVDPNFEQEAFFLRENGQPFTSKESLVNFLNDHVKPQFPWFYPYVGRHWCANARLLEWGFDYARVADWLGHEKVDMTRREYEHNARLYQRVHGKDWLLRIARQPRRHRDAKIGVSRQPTGEE